MDITYIPMAGGFVYLAVALDWFSWNSLTARQCQSRWRDGLAVDGCQCHSLVTEHRRVLQSSTGSFLTLRLRIRGTHCLAIGLRS